jgi:hypothetical protein
MIRILYYLGSQQPSFDWHHRPAVPALLKATDHPLTTGADPTSLWSTAKNLQ